MKVFNVLIVGIGGQGVILASNVLGEACIAEGVPVRCSETHGMAQRGGSVESHVRIGSKYSPLIPPGTADLILAFELLEALRYRHYLKEGGTVLANDHLIVPTSVYVQKLPLPAREEIIAQLRENAFVIDARALALEAGSPLTLNIVMVGAASPFLPLQTSSLEAGVRTWVPPKTLDMNLKAFEHGRAAVTALR
ncbi:MAG: indolepyruvate ferredoxin oxidoreductase subunit beta [Methanomicrobiales archaeon]|nr:indolepyruvate ferredoxin oxidoreductase subunit beta [Methanomicrobiales archaeon]